MFYGFDFIIIAVVVLAVFFDFINGFHDTANTIATSISTRILTPGVALVLSASMNFIGAFSNQKVAGTVAADLIDNTKIDLTVVVAALISAIVWNLVTWYFAIPSSSSHALVGSLIGASVVFTSGTQVLKIGSIMYKIIVPLFTSPLIGFALGFAIMKLLNRLFQNISPKSAKKWFSKLQMLSAAIMSFAHGSNDAQKSMGIITMALILTNHNNGSSHTQTWVIVVCAVSMALGTSVGGWKIIKTVGSHIMKMQPINGFAAQTGATLVIEAMTRLGAPVSTTHIITTAVMGVGASKRLSAVRWTVAKNIVWTWVLTIPVTIVLGGLVITVIKQFA